MYNSHKEIKRKRMRNAYKLPVKPEVMAEVRRNFTREIEFYEFCQQRLDAQYKKYLSSQGKA